MLKKAAINQLLSLRSILDQIKSEDFTLPVSSLNKATIGKHIRHVLEFYECLLFNVEDSSISYDQRKRNLLLEENLKYATDFVTQVIDELQKVEHNKRMLLVSNYDGQSVGMESSLYREITYNIEHTVHHFAIINIAIQNHFQYIELPEYFGYADSTVQYLKSQPK